MDDAATCPFEVERPVMVHRWEQLTFLHWRYDEAVVQRLLPPNLAVETFNGTAWIGLVPFLMRVGAPVGGSVWWFATFCETNVRTYVRDEAGRPGIRFFSLDAAELAPVVTARLTYRLPYFWSAMSLRADGDTVRYTCRRRWPGPRGAASRIGVEIGPAFQPGELGPLDHFLTARFRLFTGSMAARAVHAPWPLHRARAVEVADELVSAAGLPRPEGEPLVHYSPGVTVRIGRPELVRRRSTASGNEPASSVGA